MKLEAIQKQYDEAVAAADGLAAREGRDLVQSLLRELKKELKTSDPVTIIFGMGSWSLSQSSEVKVPVVWSEGEKGEEPIHALNDWNERKVWKPSKNIQKLAVQIQDACEWLTASSDGPNASTIIRDVTV